MGQASLIFEPIVRFSGQFRNGVLGEKIGVHLASGRFRGDRLGSVFTEFGQGPLVVRVGPSATGAIETVFLVELEKGLGSAGDAALPERRAASNDSRRESRRPVFSGRTPGSPSILPESGDLGVFCSWVEKRA